MKKPLIVFCLLLCLLAMYSTASAETKVSVSFHNDETLVEGYYSANFSLKSAYYNQSLLECEKNDNWVIHFDGIDTLTLRNASLKSISAEEGPLNIQLEGTNSIEPINSMQTANSHGAAVATMGDLVFSGNGSLHIDTRNMTLHNSPFENTAIHCQGNLIINGGIIDCIAGAIPSKRGAFSAGVFTAGQFTINSGSLRAVSTSDSLPAAGLFTVSNSINVNDAICECSAEFGGPPLSDNFGYYQDFGLFTFIPENSKTPCKDVKIYFSRPEDPPIITAPSAGTAASDLPQTGDRANLTVWVMMLILSVAMILKQRKTA